MMFGRPKDPQPEISGMPAGTKFSYLGRPCVVMRYASWDEAFHMGTWGMVYEYVDDRGQIHSRCVPPRDYDAFRSALQE